MGEESGVQPCSNQQVSASLREKLLVLGPPESEEPSRAPPGMRRRGGVWSCCPASLLPSALRGWGAEIQAQISSSQILRRVPRTPDPWVQVCPSLGGRARWVPCETQGGRASGVGGENRWGHCSSPKVLALRGRGRDGGEPLAETCVRFGMTWGRRTVERERSCWLSVNSTYAGELRRQASEEMCGARCDTG